MKKIFTLICAAVMAASAYADRTVLFQSSAEEGDHIASWGSGANCENVPEVKAGDVIYVTFASKTDEDSWPQVNLVTTVGEESKWTSIVNFGVYNVTSFPYEASYTIVNDAATKINEHHQLLLQGTAVYVSKIELEPTTSTDDMSSAIWIGNYDMGTSWNNGIELNSSLLANATPGQEIRIYGSHNSSINMSIRAQWNDLSPAPVLDIKDSYVAFTLTQDYLDQINAQSALRICGANFSVTHVDVVTPASYSTEAKTIEFNPDNGFVAASAFNGLSDDAKIVFNYNCENASGVINWGASRIESADADFTSDTRGSKVNDTFKVNAEGANSKSFTLAELKEYLETAATPAGKYGLYWDVWNLNECTITRTSIEAYELEGYEGTGYTAPADKAASPIYVIGDLEGSSWDPSSSATQMNYNANNGVYTLVINVNDSYHGNGWFGLSTALGTDSNDWTTFNASRLSVSGDWGTIGEKGSLATGRDESFCLEAGTYTITVDLNAMTILIESGATGIKSVKANANASVLYNLAGQRVANSANGVVIMNGKKYVK